MSKLPIFLQIEKKKVLVVGGGEAALIKIKTLLDFDANVILVSKNIISEIKKFKNIEIYERSFLPDDLKDIFIVFAVADKNINDKVFVLCKQRGILCLLANGKGDFILPAHKKTGSLTIAISTDGKYPLLAKKLCEDFYFSDQDLDYLKDKRNIVIDHEPDKYERKKVLKEILQVFPDRVKIDNIVGRYKNES